MPYVGNYSGSAPALPGRVLPASFSSTPTTANIAGPKILLRAA